MKRLLLLTLIIVIFNSCGNSEKNTISAGAKAIELEEIEYPENYLKQEIVDSTGLKTVQIDSLHYKIKWKYFNDYFKVKHIIDTLTKIDSFYNYSNDTLIGFGLRTYPSSADIGKWKMKTKDYKDTLIDHDLKWECNYFDALKIAEKEGFALPNIEVYEGTTKTSKGLSFIWYIKHSDYINSIKTSNLDHLTVNASTCECLIYNHKNKLVKSSKNQKSTE